MEMPLKVVEPGIGPMEGVPTPSRASAASMISIRSPPGLENVVPKKISLVSTTPATPISLYNETVPTTLEPGSGEGADTNDTAESDAKTKAKMAKKKKLPDDFNKKIDFYHVPSRSSCTSNADWVATPISLVDATNFIDKKRFPVKSGSLSPRRQNVNKDFNKKTRHSNVGSSRAISLVDATAGTPISLSHATAHLPRTSVYTTHIEPPDAIEMQSMLKSKYAEAMFAASTPVAPYADYMQFGNEYEFPFGTEYLVRAREITPAKTTPSYPGPPGLSLPVEAGWKPRSEIYTDNNDHTTSEETPVEGKDQSEEETPVERKERSPAAKWLSDATELLKESLAKEEAKTQAVFNQPPLADGEVSQEFLWGEEGSPRLPAHEASTLVWISELAFKQSGTDTRESLENYRVSLKAHKSAQKAIRSLGKREAKAVRFDSAAVIVSPKEAWEFMRFLSTPSSPSAEASAEIRPCCVIIGPGIIHRDLHRYVILLKIPPSTCVRFCPTWEDIYGILETILVPPLQSV